MIPYSTQVAFIGPMRLWNLRACVNAMPWFFINLDPTIGGPGQVNSSKGQKGSSNGRPASPQQPTRYRNVQIFQAVDIDVSCPPVDAAMKNSAPDIIISPKHQQFLSRERFPGFSPIHPPSNHWNSPRGKMAFWSSCQGMLPRPITGPRDQALVQWKHITFCA